MKPWDWKSIRPAPPRPDHVPAMGEIPAAINLRRPGSGAGFRSGGRGEKRPRLDAVAVGIADEGGVVALAVMRAEAGAAVRRAARRQRSRMERIDRRHGRGAQADMDA